jgi:hypothetical protein
MAIPLLLSAFTHMLNPVGFPCVVTDEGVYMRRAMHVLQGLGPQDSASRFDHGQGPASSYDHPYFGQLFLAGVFAIIGYVNLLNPSSFNSYGNALHSIETLYMVPRILMGILAVVDTFLIYKISERRYNRNVALIASVLFAVMPLSWLFRRVLLDSILMPFLLSSILLALYANTKVGGFSINNNTTINNNKKSGKNIVLILLSGVFLGLAIFTKMPALTMIPLVGFLIYKNNYSHNGSLKNLGLWFVPVILIPLIWPGYSILVNQFGEWLNGVLWQATGRQGIGIMSIDSIFRMDPVLVALGLAGVVLAVIIKRDLFPLLWLIPFLIFISLVGWVVYFHWMLVLPAFCIGAAVLIEDLSHRIARRKKKVQQMLLSFSITSAIGIFGLISTILLITNNFSLSQFEAAAFVAQIVQDRSNHASSGESVSNNTNNYNNDITIISAPIYSWIFKNVFNKAHVLSHPRDSSQPITKRVLLMVDSSYAHWFSDALTKKEVEDEKQVQKLGNIYNSTNTIASFADTGVQYDYRIYPYVGIRDCQSSAIQVRTNY